MATRQSSAERNGSIAQPILRPTLSRNPALLKALEFLFSSQPDSLSFQDLRLQPIVGVHRNPFSDAPFLLPKERFGGSKDLALVPLVRHVVDETLRAYAHESPHLLEYVGNTPISPYGSLGLSVSRWGQVDWDYIRDLDWRIFLPPEIGHVSGFKSELESVLSQKLIQYGLHPVLFGKDEQGLPQVQLRESRTAAIHGFHFYLAAMKPGFVRGNIHLDGAYSPHFAYFPEDSLDEHLESARLLWSDLIVQQRENYVEMFNKLSFNIFGENTGPDRLYKTPGWYLHKAFKWYATLARMRGLSSLEEDLLYQYEHFRGSEGELSYLARYRYYARMAPSRPRIDDVDRDLARTLSIAYAQARSSRDPLVGQSISVESTDIVLLETVPESFRRAALTLLDQVKSSLPNHLKCAAIAGQIRFADNLPAPSCVHLDGRRQAILIPAEWSMVFCDSYVLRAMKCVAKENRSMKQKEIRGALALALVSLLLQATRVPVPLAPTRNNAHIRR